MNFVCLILILTISYTQSKHLSFRDDDIEKVFYFKDSLRNRAKTEAPPPPPPPPPPTRAPPSNNYCQSNCCFGCCCNGNNFNNNPNNNFNNNFKNNPNNNFNDQMGDFNINDPLPQEQLKPVLDNLVPLNFRRSTALSKEHIKNLISHDEDIKKILKDLVRVTMQKISVMDMFKRAHVMKQAERNFSVE